MQFCCLQTILSLPKEAALCWRVHKTGVWVTFCPIFPAWPCLLFLHMVGVPCPGAWCPLITACPLHKPCSGCPGPWPGSHVGLESPAGVDPASVTPHMPPCASVCVFSLSENGSECSTRQLVLLRATHEGIHTEHVAHSKRLWPWWWLVFRASAERQHWRALSVFPQRRRGRGLPQLIPSRGPGKPRIIHPVLLPNNAWAYLLLAYFYN